MKENVSRIAEDRFGALKKYEHPVFRGSLFVEMFEVKAIIDFVIDQYEKLSENFKTLEGMYDQLYDQTKNCTEHNQTCDTCGFNSDRRCKNPNGIVKKTVDLPDGFGCTAYSACRGEHGAQ